MSKVITFSRVYPSYHPRAGEPTYFVEKILNSIYTKGENGIIDRSSILPSTLEIINDFVLLDGECKHHTIRAGHRWKAGDWFKPVVWMLPGGRFTKGNKQIQFAPDIQIKKVWDISIERAKTYYAFRMRDALLSCYDETVLASNDGLTREDLVMWFNKTADCQIICWNESINY